MSADDWILALHLLAAFALVAGIFGVWAMIAGGWNVASPGDVRAIFRFGPLLNGLAGVSAVVALALGIWLAISLDAYQPWDGWVIAAIVLWVIMAGAGDRAVAQYARASDRAGELLRSGGDGPSPELRELVRTRRGLALQAVATLAALLILADMIWKPGA
jgi:Predicted integral membrane protein (DUF2269)